MKSEQFITGSRHLTVIGAGVIGVSWVALFLAKGFKVVLHDVHINRFEQALAQLEDIRPSLMKLDLNFEIQDLRFEIDLKEAVRNASIIQECGPDRIQFKADLWAEVERFSPPDALFLSSSSGIPTRYQARKMQSPGRLMIGHPFNPPHLIPLVEVVGHKLSSVEQVQRAMEFYRQVGKRPVLLHKEVPGFVANRLQSALLRESMLMVKWGVVNVDELDEIVTQSIGLRWSTGGPFRSFHLGGGAGGFRHFIDHFSRGVQLLWLHSKFSPLRFSKSLTQKILGQIDSSFGSIPLNQLERERDCKQVAVIKALENTTKQ